MRRIQNQGRELHNTSQPSGYKRRKIVIFFICIGLSAVCASLFWNHGWLRVRVAWSSEQTEIFDEMRARALRGDASGAAGCLEYVVEYYPSGSKQVPGSQLDREVERARALAIRDIIACLRTKTGEDLGENPEAWIQKYAKH